jgi:adenylate cyclase
MSGVFALAATLVVFALSHSDFFRGYELKSLDFFQTFNEPLIEAPIVMVEIDQQSLNVVSQHGIQWPWPRQMYEPVVDLCVRAGVKGLLFDIIFSEPSSYGKEDDRVLARALEQADNVFLPVTFSRHRGNHTALTPIQRFGIQRNHPVPTFRVAQSYIPPIDELAEIAEGVGDVIVSPDRDGIYRRVNLFTRYREYLFPTLAAAPVLHQFRFGDGGVHFAGKKLSLSGEGELLLHYYGQGMQFPRMNVLEMISAHQRPTGDVFDRVTRQLRNRYVIVALTAPGLYDLKPTAVNPVSPGASVHGTLLANLLLGHHIHQLNERSRLPLVFALCALLSVSALSMVSLWKKGLVFLIFVLGWPMASYILFFNQRIWAGLFYPEVAIFSVFIMTATFSYHTEGKKRRMIRRLFSQYMSEVLVRELEENPQRATLGGNRRMITIFFSDLADFTALSEQLEPEEIVSLLNMYFTEMSQIILDTQGVIDKYQGDGIMAFWGAPIELADHAAYACRAALACSKRMETINKRLGGRDLPPLQMRIGLHSGEAVVGNMGSNQRFDYTVIGDNVNLASRLEGANKKFGTQIIVSEATYGLAREKVEARELDQIAVKGKQRPIRIFELAGEKDEISPEFRRARRWFEKGLHQYREKRFDEAIELFRKVLAANPTDGPARVFLERCHQLVQRPPASDWDGILRLTEK